MEETGQQSLLADSKRDYRPFSHPPLSHTEQRREKIEEHLEQIDERLRELEGEKDELNSFAELDSRRRALEYAIYHREDTEVNAKLKEVSRQISSPGWALFLWHSQPLMCVYL